MKFWLHHQHLATRPSDRENEPGRFLVEIVERSITMSESILIKAHGAISRVKLFGGAELHQIHTWLQTEHIERVELAQGIAMWIDENSFSMPEVIANWPATILARSCRAIDATEIIAGNALITGCDDNTETIDLDEPTAQTLICRLEQIHDREPIRSNDLGVFFEFRRRSLNSYQHLAATLTRLEPIPIALDDYLPGVSTPQEMTQSLEFVHRILCEYPGEDEHIAILAAAVVLLWAGMHLAYTDHNHRPLAIAAAMVTTHHCNLILSTADNILPKNPEHKY